jgi:apolipoprotein N-acyltransferase
VLWPETVFPYDILYDVDLKYYVKYLATSNETTVIASAFSEPKDSDGFYNSLVEVEPDGSFGDMYHKQHLVPFGEYVPMREVIMFLVPPLASISVLESDLVAGDKSLIMDTEIGRVGCAICYDSIFEEVIINSCREGAELLAISTNDSWFSNSAALDMHNAQARLRAIESGKYVIRAANTGISSIIDPMGNLIDSIDEGRSGYIVEDVYMREQNTLYTCIGNLFVYLCIACLLSTPIYAVVKYINNKAKRP